MRKFFVFFLLFFMFAGLAAASMDDTHGFLAQLFCDDKSWTNDFKIVFCANFDAAVIGSVMPDLGILRYFDQFPNAYTETHIPGTCDNLLANSRNERERVYAHASCMAHMIPDFVSHHYFVPWTISHTGFGNFPMHIFAEEKVNDWVISKNPEASQLMNTYLLGEDGNAWKEFVPVTQRALTTMDEYKGVGDRGIEGYMGKLVDEITCSKLSSQYTDIEKEICSRTFLSGWKYMWVIPWYFYVAAALVAVLVIIFIIKLFTFVRKWNWLAYLSVFIGICVFFIFAVAIYGTVTGNLFAYMQRYSAPLTAITPTLDIETALNDAKLLMDKYAKAVASMDSLDAPPVFDEIVKPDAHGFGALRKAEEPQIAFRWLFFIIVALLIILFGYLHFTKKKVFLNWFRKK